MPGMSKCILVKGVRLESPQTPLIGPLFKIAWDLFSEVREFRARIRGPVTIWWHTEPTFDEVPDGGALRLRAYFQPHLEQVAA